MLGTHGSLLWPHGVGGRKGSEVLSTQTEEKLGGREGLEGPREFGNWGNWSNWDNRSIETLKTVFERKSPPPGHWKSGKADDPWELKTSVSTLFFGLGSRCVRSTFF